MRLSNGLLAVAATMLLAGCAAESVQEPVLSEDAVEARLVPESLPAAEAAGASSTIPDLVQLKPSVGSATPEPRDPVERVRRANDAARIEPSREQYVSATQIWSYSADALYQVYTCPERITDIALEPGEELISVSAGDTVRWVIGDTTSGNAGGERVHILVKPTRENLSTNLVIHSDRRSYHLEMTSTVRSWMAAIAWSYPLDRLRVLQHPREQREEGNATGSDIPLDRLNFQYDIDGDKAPWRPVRAFDDGAKVYIEFPADIAQAEMPPLFVVGAQADAQLVNYRVRGRYYIVDRLFSTAELRLGGERVAKVRIRRMKKKVGERSDGA